MQLTVVITERDEYKGSAVKSALIGFVRATEPEAGCGRREARDRQNLSVFHVP
jgi:hypothetical protein